MPNRRLLKNLISLAKCSGVYAVVSIQALGKFFEMLRPFVVGT